MAKTSLVVLLGSVAALAVFLPLPVVEITSAATAAPAAQQAEEEEDQPTQAPLTLGSMAIASDPGLLIEGMAVDVALDHVGYAYKLRNKGKTKLQLAASVALPDLEVNTDANNVYELPTQVPDNPEKLEVKVNDKPVPTTPYVQAIALGIDRASNLKAEGMPLIPFGAATDKAIAAAKPEQLAKLQALGLVTPRDPAQPDAPVIADWSLHVVQGFTLTLEPESVSNVVVGFQPVKAIYHVDLASLTGFNALKDQVCLTPQIMNTVKGLAKAKGAVITVSDITLANDGPARWLDNPPATVAVRKPQPNSVVAFCGIDAASAGKPVVTGKMPGSDAAAGLRVLIFTPGS